jgi:hypothetical protein
MRRETTPLILGIAHKTVFFICLPPFFRIKNGGVAEVAIELGGLYPLSSQSPGTPTYSMPKRTEIKAFKLNGSLKPSNGRFF